MHHLEASKGCTIGRFAHDLLLAHEVIDVVGIFNDVHLHVTDDSTVESIINDYWAQREKQYEEV